MPEWLQTVTKTRKFASNIETIMTVIKVLPHAMTNPDQQPCNPSTSILEGDLVLAAEKQIIDRLKVKETPVGFYVVAQFSDKPQILQTYKDVGVPDWFYILAQLLAEPGKEWYLATRRNRYAPKLFKDLMLLNRHLKHICQSENFEVVRGQALPGMPKTKMRSAKATG